MSGLAPVISVVSLIYGLYSFPQPRFDKAVQFFSLLIGIILTAGTVALYLSWY